MSLDREIEALLAVDHSPELAAKIRARVAAERMPRPARFSWALVPAGAGMAVAAVAAMLWLPGRSAPVAVEPRSAVAVMEPAAATPAAPVTLAGNAVPEAVREPAPTLARVAAPAANPEILISPEDGRAFRLLLTRVGEGLVVALPEGDADQPAVGPPWIEIAPVVIEPLAHLAQDEGGRQ
jgi:hypothetical protein